MRPAWSGSDLAVLTEQITREVTRQLDPSGGARPPRKRSSTRDIPSDSYRASVITPDESGARAGSVEFEPHQHAEPRTPPPYEEPGPYPGLEHQTDAPGGYDAPSRTLGQPAPRAARWTPGAVREESGPKSAMAGPSWSPPLSTPEPEPRDSDPVWQPPEWLTPAKRYPSAPESSEPPSWSPPPSSSASPSQKPTWAPPGGAQASPQAPMPAAVAWTPPPAQPPTRPAEASPAQAVRPSAVAAVAAVAASEDEYVDGGFASEFDDDEFDDGPGSDDEFPPLDLAAASGRHRKRRRRLDQPAIEIPVQPTAGAAARGHESVQPFATPPPLDAFGDDDDFEDEPASTPAMSGMPDVAQSAPSAKSERPKAKQPRDDDDDFDDDDDDDDFDDDDDDDDDPAANSSSQLGASVTAQKNPSGGRKLPWIPIVAVAGGLVLVLAFAFRETLFGPGDGGEVADSAGETSTDGAEPAVEPEPQPKPEVEPQPVPEPEPKPPAIPTEELDAKIAEATSLVNRQKFDDARVILDEVLGKIPNEGRALALLAQTYLEKNKLEDALKTANDCVAADAGQAFCWIVIATVEQANDNFPRALEAYRKYIEIEPTGQHAKSSKKQITRLEGKVQG